MRTFAVDSFTEASDTAIGSHVPEVGGGWTLRNSTMTVVGSEDRLKGDSAAATGLATIDTAARTADVDITATIRHTSATVDATAHNGIIGRYVDASNNYSAYYNKQSGPAIVLDKIVAGVGTNIGSYATTLTINTDYTLRLLIVGTSIKVYLDGVERISVTDTGVSAAGLVGIRSRSNGRVDNLTAIDYSNESTFTMMGV